MKPKWAELLDRREYGEGSLRQYALTENVSFAGNTYFEGERVTALRASDRALWVRFPDGEEGFVANENLSPVGMVGPFEQKDTDTLSVVGMSGGSNHNAVVVMDDGRAFILMAPMKEGQTWSWKELPAVPHTLVWHERRGVHLNRER